MYCVCPIPVLSCLSASGLLLCIYVSFCLFVCGCTCNYGGLPSSTISNDPNNSFLYSSWVTVSAFIFFLMLTCIPLYAWRKAMQLVSTRIQSHKITVKIVVIKQPWCCYIRRVGPFQNLYQPQKTNFEIHYVYKNKNCDENIFPLFYMFRSCCRCGIWATKVNDIRVI